jgi:hypothetical protein
MPPLGLDARGLVADVARVPDHGVMGLDVGRHDVKVFKSLVTISERKLNLKYFLHFFVVA